MVLQESESLMVNLCAGWTLFFAGIVAGAVAGVFFHKNEWLGGYTSWRRRMVRLGHVAFFGIGLINVAFGLTVQSVDIEASQVPVSSWLLIAGGIGMPAVCYLSAWRKGFRHSFFVPVLCVGLGVGLFLWRLLEL